MSELKIVPLILSFKLIEDEKCNLLFINGIRVAIYDFDIDRLFDMLDMQIFVKWMYIIRYSCNHSYACYICKWHLLLLNNSTKK